VQGPPGTGKTTVICELVRQLTSRGERVLLLTPAHVAVDEVLRRVGRKPGIRALRLSWNDSLVEEDLRCFMPDRAGGEFAAALRRPGMSNAERWAARLRSLNAEIAMIDRLSGAWRTRDEAARLAMAAQSAERTARQQLDEHGRREEWESAALRQELAVASEQEKAAAAGASQAGEEEDAAWAGFASCRPPIDHLCRAVGALAASTHDLMLAEHDQQEAERRRREWQSSWSTRRQWLDGALTALAGPHEAATRAAAESWNEVQRAEAVLHEAQARRGWWGRLADALGLGRVSRLEDDLDRVWQVWVRLDSDWRGWESERERRLDESRRLDAEPADTGERLTQEAAAALARRQAAATTRQSAVALWQTATQAAAGTVLAEPGQPDAVLTRMQQVLSHPAETGPLPASLTGTAFRQAHDRLRRARETRVGLDADLAAARQSRSAADEALRARRSALAAQRTQLADRLSKAASDRVAAESTMATATSDLAAAMTSLGYPSLPAEEELAERRTGLTRQVRVLPRYAELERRWFELMAGRSEADVITEVGDALVRSVNLVCATTTGIAGLSARVVQHADFDTLIVDEASRVTDSEFVIGAVRARRWILVGDEHQLPPHVEQADEYHLHALAALHRLERGTASTLEESVGHLAQLWREDDEQRVFRTGSVIEVALRLRDSGGWQDRYRTVFADAHSHFRGSDPDRHFLATMRDHLVRSLLERTVEHSPDGLRQRLEEQRRMIAPIAEIVRTPIYRGAYTTPDDDELARSGLRPLTTPTFDRPVVFLDTSLQPDATERQVGHGFVNDLECAWIELACLRYEAELRHHKDADRPVSVNVLCFYQAQALELRRRLGAPLYPRFRRLSFDKIAPIDRLQGQESDLVFVTFSQANPTPGQNFGRWLQDLRRLNVACTRAHRALVLVGHRQMLSRLRATPASADFYQHLHRLFSESGNYLLMTDFLR
jgi:AAA domain